MTPDAPSFAAFIIGTGRSGTSLTTQALDRLGLLMPDDQVPANENNLRGTGESIAIRDQMAALSRALGCGSGLLPTDWQASPASRNRSDWIEKYLSTQRETAQGKGFVIKFPRASIFLPLWRDVAQRIGLPLRFIWATRNAADTLSSLLRSTHATSADSAQMVYAQRCFYILRDAPPDTILLPYEGWTTAPGAQVDSLAKLTGVTDARLREYAVSAFSAMLGGTASDNADPLPDAIARLDGIIKAKRGRLDDVLPVITAAYDRLCVDLADLVEDLRPANRPAHALDAMNARLSLITKLAATPDTETIEMKEQLEILTQRIRDVNTRNKQLEQQIPGRGKAARSGQTASSPAANGNGGAAAEADQPVPEQGLDSRIEIERLKSAYAALTREKDAFEENITALGHERIRALEITEARQRTRSGILQKRLDETELLLKAAEERETQQRVNSEDRQKRLLETADQLKAAKDQLSAYADLATRLRGQIEGAKKQRDDAQRRTASVMAEIARLRSLQKIQSQKIKSLGSENVILARKNAELAGNLDHMTRHRDALLSSTSWKLTGPMRRIVRLVRR